MNIDNEIKNDVGKTLLNGGEKILNIGGGEYIQVISDLKENVFKILYLINKKPELNIDNAIGNSIMLSNQTQEVIDKDKYMISIVEKLDTYHYTKFTHLDYRKNGIMSGLFNMMNDIYPLETEWTERLGVYKFLLKNGFRVTHVMNFPNLVRPFTDNITQELEDLEKEGIDILPYKVYFKNIRQEFLGKINKIKENENNLFYNTTGSKDMYFEGIRHIGSAGFGGYLDAFTSGVLIKNNNGEVKIKKDFYMVDFEKNEIIKQKKGKLIRVVEMISE